MIYLLIGSLAPAMAAFPYLLLLGYVSSLHPLLVRIAMVQTNLLVAGLLVVLAYATAYFGVTYSDRVVKGRLFQWLLRGPLVAAAALAVLVAATSFFDRMGMPGSRLILVAVVMVIILLQFAITVGRVPLERMLFVETRSDREEIRRLQWLEERLLTGSDLRQFLESILAALCDITRCPAAFVIEWNEGGAAFLAGVGSRSLLPLEKDLSTLPKPEVLEYIPGTGSLFRWGGFWLLPLHAPDREEMVGMIGLAAFADHLELAPEQHEPLSRLMERAAGALADERLQREVFSALDLLMPDVEKIQRLSAAARYGQANLLAAPANGGAAAADLAQWVREALSHYWGGPKLTTIPAAEPARGARGTGFARRERGQRAARRFAPGGRPGAPGGGTAVHQRVAAVQHSGDEIPGRQTGPRRGAAPGCIRGGPLPQTETGDRRSGARDRRHGKTVERTGDRL